MSLTKRTAAEILGVYALWELRCRSCHGTALRRSRTKDGLEPSEPCARCTAGRLRYQLRITSVTDGPSVPRRATIAIVRHDDLRGRRLAFSAVEPALRAYATLCELPIDTVLRLWPEPSLNDDAGTLLHA